jgi:hypothetical protein
MKFMLMTCRDVTMKYITYLLISWCRTLLEKLIVSQLVKKYPALLRNPKFHYLVNTSLPLDPILSQLNPVRPIHPFPLRSVLILSFHLRLGLPSGSCLRASQLKPCTHLSPPHACHISSPPHPSCFNHPNRKFYMDLGRLRNVEEFRKISECVERLRKVLQLL